MNTEMTYTCAFCGKEKRVRDVYGVWDLIKKGWRTQYGYTYCHKCVKKIDKLGVEAMDRELDTAMKMAKAFVINIADSN